MPLLRYDKSLALGSGLKGPSLGQEERLSSAYREYISMVVSDELLYKSSEDCVSPGVDGAVKLEGGEGESEGVGFGRSEVTGTIFEDSIKRR